MEQDYLIDDGLVERLHAALAEALRRNRTDPFGSPVTVAEIYQDLVPYRSVRTALGFQMNADYEYTVLRMLAGEGGRARLEPPEAREELRAELEAPNPNVGLFRKFAACDVWVEPSDAPAPEPAAMVEPAPMSALPEPVHHEADSFTPPREAAAEAEPFALTEPHEPSPIADTDHPEMALPEPEESADFDLPANAAVEEPEATGDLADLSQVDWESEGVVWAGPGPSGGWEEPPSELLLDETVEDTVVPPDTSGQGAPVREEATQQPETHVMFDQNQTRTPVATATATGGCPFCQSSLPSGRVVRFCPHCGSDQSMSPCGNCREPLDPSWKFCISCGDQQN